MEEAHEDTNKREKVANNEFESYVESVGMAMCGDDTDGVSMGHVNDGGVDGKLWYLSHIHI